MNHPGHWNRRQFLRAIASAGSVTATGYSPALQARTRQFIPFPLEAFQRFDWWQREDFQQAWGPPPVSSGLTCRLWPGALLLAGTLPVQSIAGLWRSGHLIQISFVVLDAGNWFGFGKTPASAGSREQLIEEFSGEFQKTTREVRKFLPETAQDSETLTIGRGTQLAHEVEIMSAGDLWLRLTIAENQLIKFVLTPTERDASDVLASFRETSKRQQREYFEAIPAVTSRGDVVIEGLPIFPQGDRAYCGVSTLAMVMQHAGLRLDTEDYAMAARIRFGSTEDSEIRETYEAAEALAEIRFKRSLRFDFDKARRSIDEGFPVVVHRRFSQQRDYLHTHFTRRWREDPALELPRPDPKDQAQWPGNEAYTHASVINGYHEDRGEVIFTESWTDQFRNRRMRAEELEATSYMAYYGSL